VAHSLLNELRGEVESHMALMVEFYALLNRMVVHEGEGS
jgi:hypothetical protein